jgi:hypothetical protein
MAQNKVCLVVDTGAHDCVEVEIPTGRLRLGLYLLKLAGQFIKLVWNFRVMSLNVFAGEFIHPFFYLFACHKGHRSP